MTRKLTTLPLLCKLFKGISAEEVEPLIGRLEANVKTLSKGEVLFRTGTKADQAGRLRSSRTARQRNG